MTDEPWILPGVALSFVASLLLAIPASHALRSSRFGAWTLLMSLGLVLAGTLTPLRDLGGPDGPPSCDFSRIELAPLAELVAVNDTSFNVLMVVPLGIAVGILPRSRGKASILLLSIALPFAIEAAQALVPWLERGCESADVVDNLTGLTLGLAVGATAGTTAAIARWAVGKGR